MPFTPKTGARSHRLAKENCSRLREWSRVNLRNGVVDSIFVGLWIVIILSLFRSQRAHLSDTPETEAPRRTTIRLRIFTYLHLVFTILIVAYALTHYDSILIWTIAGVLATSAVLQVDAIKSPRRYREPVSSSITLFSMSVNFSLIFILLGWVTFDFIYYTENRRAYGLQDCQRFESTIPRQILHAPKKKKEKSL